MTNSHQGLVIGQGGTEDRGMGVRALGTSPRERLREVAIVVCVCVCVKIFVLIFIGTIIETYIYWNI